MFKKTLKKEDEERQEWKLWKKDEGNFEIKEEGNSGKKIVENLKTEEGNSEIKIKKTEKKKKRTLKKEEGKLEKKRREIVKKIGWKVLKLGREYWHLR